MGRMHEIMKERVEVDEVLSRFVKVRKNILNRLDEEMKTVGPIKVGDIVTANDDDHAGEKMMVDVVWIVNERGKLGVIAEGRVLKEDGTPCGEWEMAEHFIEVGAAP